MCGIYGEISLVNKQVNRIEFTQALDQFEKSGPDSSGTFFKDNIALRHRTLSIISTLEFLHQFTRLEQC